MAEICNPSCNDTPIQNYPIPCRRQQATRKGGFERFILLDCDLTFTSLTSQSEWSTAKYAQRFVVSPPGLGNLTKPETTKEKLTACSPEEPIDEVSGAEWHTKLFDNDTYLDFDFENDIKDRVSSKTFMFLGCDGLFYYKRSWTAGTNPGMGDLVAEVWRDSEPGTLQKLHADFKFNTYQQGWTAFEPTDALKSIIFDDDYITSGGDGI